MGCRSDRLAGLRTLAGFHLPQQGQGGLQNNLEILYRGEVVHVMIVHLHHLTEGRVLVPVDLPLPGKAGLDREPMALVLIVKFVFLGQARARPHQAHFSAKDIDELGKFIKTRHPDQTSSFDQSGISDDIQFGHRPVVFDEMLNMSLMNARRGSELHAAELVDRKGFAIPSDPRLPEKNISRRDQLDPGVNSGRQEHNDRQNQKNEKNVRSALPMRER